MANIPSGQDIAQAGCEQLLGFADAVVDAANAQQKIIADTGAGYGVRVRALFTLYALSQKHELITLMYVGFRNCGPLSDIPPWPHSVRDYEDPFEEFL